MDAAIPDTLTDGTLPTFTEQFSSTEGCLYRLFEKCGGELQQIEPYSS